MLIDCETCTARDVACEDCVVAVLLRRPSHSPPSVLELDAGERAALGNLAEAGLVPPLRLVPLFRDPPLGAPDGPAAGVRSTA